MEVNGAYTPDPGKARIIFKIDGKEILNQEFAYHDEKAFVVRVQPQVAARPITRLTIELQPTVPAEKKETIIDLFVHKVTIEGPLEKSQWVKTENYDRYFPRAVPDGRQAAPRLCERAAGRVRAEGLSASVVTGGWRRHGERLADTRRSVTTASPASHSNKAWRTPWRRCCRRRASCSARSAGGARAERAGRRRRRIFARLAPLLFPVVDDARRGAA